MTILDGKKLKSILLTNLKSEAEQLKKTHKKAPGLAVILIGNNPASHAYVNMKKKACIELGYQSFDYNFPETVHEKDIINLISTLNFNQDVHGILLQLPLPNQLDTNKLLELISPEKDVDGFHPINIGKLLQGLPCLKSCTPFGVIKLMEHYKIETEGKHIVIIGRSNIVGKPLAAMLMQRSNPGNATVTICHSRSQNLNSITTSADILIAAIGKPLFVTNDMIKENATVIDVGINRVTDNTTKTGYKLVGDVDYENVKSKSSAITPVPGGIGPLTIAMLMTNTLTAFKSSLENS